VRLNGAAAIDNACGYRCPRARSRCGAGEGKRCARVIASSRGSSYWFRTRLQYIRVRLSIDCNPALQTHTDISVRYRYAHRGHRCTHGYRCAHGERAIDASMLRLLSKPFEANESRPLLSSLLSSSLSLSASLSPLALLSAYTFLSALASCSRFPRLPVPAPRGQPAPSLG
jgi:hypothetical protein